MNTIEIKEIVKKKYGEIALTANGGCGCGCASDAPDNVFMDEDYSQQEGYVADANLNLGCGLPTAFAELKAGQTIVDLGSGAGNDAFIAAHKVGPTGRVIGIDMTPAMIERAEINRRKVGLSNVEFKLGEIENMPLDDAVADVVLSNCVINLVPDKKKAFAEIHRILKSGGYFVISDVVVEGEMSPAAKAAAELYSGCISGAMAKHDYLQVIRDAGFRDIRLDKEREVPVPQDLLDRVLAAVPADQRTLGNARVLSITVHAVK